MLGKEWLLRQQNVWWEFDVKFDVKSVCKMWFAACFYQWFVRFVCFIVHVLLCFHRVTQHFPCDDENLLTFRSRTAFERAKTDVLRIRTQNVGPLKKIRYISSLIHIVLRLWHWFFFSCLFFLPFSRSELLFFLLQNWAWQHWPEPKLVPG